MTASGTISVQTPIAGLVELALTRSLLGRDRRAVPPTDPPISRSSARPAPGCSSPARCARGQGPLLVVTATGREADDLTAELRGVFGDAVAMFPSWETLPHERLSPGVDTVGARLMVLRRLAHPDDARLGPPLRVVVTTARSLLQPMAPDAGRRRTGDADASAGRGGLRRADRAAGRTGLHPRRHGRQARRVRGARRHPRPLPADRRASGARRVLGRRGVRDADVLGRRPALDPGDRRRHA